MKQKPVRVRRFEPGASGLGYDGFLESCGYKVSQRLREYSVKRVGAPGRERHMSRKQLVSLLNTERMKRGLEPITRNAV